MSYYDPRDINRSPLSRFAEKLFPQRQLMIRSQGRLRAYRLGAASQIAVIAISVVLAAWAGYSSYSVLKHQSVLSKKNAEINETLTAYRALAAQVSVYQKKISEVTAGLERNHAHALSLTQDGDRFGDGLKNARQDLDVARAEREKAEESSRKLMGRVAKLKGELLAGDASGRDLSDEAGTETLSTSDDLVFARRRADAEQERDGLRAELARLEKQMVQVSDDALINSGLDMIEVELRKVAMERDLAAAERDALRHKVSGLRNRLAEMEDGQTVLFERFAELADHRVDALRKAVSGTGLNLDKLLKKNGVSAQGGPFVPLSMKGAVNAEMEKTLASLNEKLTNWNTVRNLVNVLPLSQPLHGKWYMTSPFGMRKDPFTGKPAMHQGLDMAAPFKSPVYATASGKVVYAGWRGQYGRMVEIDHGNGVKTRFAHLNKVLVKKGDLVTRSSRVGLLGSSGRSTGPHLHYEVIYNGKHRDPNKFIKAGANVLQG